MRLGKSLKKSLKKGLQIASNCTVLLVLMLLTPVLQAAAVEPGEEGISGALATGIAPPRRAPARASPTTTDTAPCHVRLSRFGDTSRPNRRNVRYFPTTSS